MGGWWPGVVRSAVLASVVCSRRRSEPLPVPPDLRDEASDGGNCVDSRGLDGFGPAYVLDEHLLAEAVGFLHVRVVMALAGLANLRERLDVERASGLAESLESVLG